MSVPNVQDVAGPLPTTAIPVQPSPDQFAPPPVAPPFTTPIPPAAVAGSPAAAPIPAAPPPEIPIEADVPTPTNPVQAAQQISRQTTEVGKEEVANQQQKTVLDQEQAAKKQAFDEANAQALETFQKQQALHREAATAQVQNLQNQYESQPFTSLWSKLSTGQRVATALSVLAAGISWNSNHTNRALDMLDKAESEDLDIQKEQHASLLHSIQLAMEGKKDLEASQLHELSDWQAMQAAKWQAISSKLQSLLATNKGNIDTTAVKKAALEANAKANQGVEGAITAKSTANHMDAEANLARENAKKVPAEIDKLKAEAEKERAIASGAIGPQGGVNIDIKLGNEVDKRLNADKELPKLLNGRDEIAKGLANLGPGANGVQVQGAVDNYIKAATSGKVTAYQAKVFKERSGGLVDKILGDIAKGQSGNYGPEQIATLKRAFEAARDENERVLRESRQKHTQALKADPLLARVPGQIDSALSERFGDAGKFVPPPGSRPGNYKGQKVYGTPDGKIYSLDGTELK
jgi:hypothetical protein